MAARSPEIPWKSNLAPPPTSAHIIPTGERCSVNISRLLTLSNKTSPTLHRGGVSRRSRWPTKVCNSSMDFEMPRLSLVFCTWRDTISHTHGETDGQRHARIHVRLMLHFPRRGNVDLWRRLKTGNKNAIFRMNFHYERYTITRSSKLRRFLIITFAISKFLRHVRSFLLRSDVSEKFKDNILPNLSLLIATFAWNETTDLLFIVRVSSSFFFSTARLKPISTSKFIDPRSEKKISR